LDEIGGVGMAQKLSHYKHYKGGEYLIVGFSQDEVTLEPLVHYVPKKEPHRLPWTRKAEVFFGYVEVPEEVNKVQRRFTPVYEEGE
jgi:hypothetical protein